LRPRFGLSQRKDPFREFTLQNIDAADFIFAGTYGRGMFRSTDSGHHWQKINFRNGYIFVGADFVGGAGGVYGSGDYGENWVEISHDMIPTVLCALSTNPSGHIFAGTYFGGVFRSTNNGDSWTPVNNGLDCGNI
jgi:photosystem II stability/assembly factor-like uncharacterized protein